MTKKQPKVSSDTPWGKAQDVTWLADGIVFVGTAGHGGIWVSPARMEEMPEHLRKIGSESSFHQGWPNWFEEDCEYAAVICAFPDRFNEDEVTRADKMLHTVYPEAWNSMQD